MNISANNVERVDIDPRQLLLDVNIRTDARLDREFVASVKDLGVLVPIVAVRTPDGSIRVRYGHRRTLAAIESSLDTVPVEIVGDESSDDAAQIARIVSQHAENEHRAGLTQDERLNVIEQLSAFGLSANQIHKRIKMKRPLVDQALKVSASEQAKAAAIEHDFLSLEQAAAIAEFDGDIDAVRALVSAAKDGRFDHCLQRLRDKGEEQEAKNQATTALVEAGICVVDQPAWSDDGVVRLSSLTQDGESLDEVTHVECPGHAAFLESDWRNTNDDEDSDEGWELTYVPSYVCTTPEVHDAQSGNPRAADEPVDTEAASAERKLVLANNKAWRSAESVRRDWLRSFLMAKSAPKDALSFIAQELMFGGHELRTAIERRHAFSAELLGFGPPTGYAGPPTELVVAIEQATDGRMLVIVLGLILGAHEVQTGVRSWRSSHAGTKRYLIALQAWGYGLSEVELLVVQEEVAK